MNRKARRAGKISPHTDAAAHEAALAQGDACLARGDAKSAAAAAQAVLAAAPRSATAHYLLGNARLFERQLEAAETSYRRVIELAPTAPKARYSLGVALDLQGQFEAAADAFRAATALNRDYLEAYCGLAGVLTKLGQPAEAVEIYRKALALRPRFPEVLNNLSFLLLGLNRPAEAATACREAIAIDPATPESRYNLGNALRDCGQLTEAEAAYRQAMALRPDHAEAHIALGNLLLLRNRDDEANALFRRAYRLRPLSKKAATKRTPDFSALLLIVPGLANTPSDYLLRQTSYDSYLLGVLAGIEPDVEDLRQKCDVVVNLISDADDSREILPRVVELAERLGRPILNHPRKILGTGREQIAGRLARIPRCRVPKTIRRPGAVLASASLPQHLAGFSFPLLMRICGTHGGDEFEKLTDEDAVRAFVSRKPGAEYYVIEFVPYESEDGHYRKYRFFFVGGEIFPYHLAIGDGWKVHHFRTNMANQAWMREEEEAFVRDPTTVFKPEHWNALRMIQTTVGLDYFGIDCALDRNGDLVVFEVNATMLVHGEKDIFAYKEPYIARIKSAFDAMLSKAARGH